MFWGASGAQVQVQPGSATPKLMPVKPKVYLTASVKIPAKSWVKLGWREPRDRG